MATHVPFPAPEQIDDFPSSTTAPRSLPILRRTMGLAVPVLLDLSCIAIACVVAIVLYKLQTPTYDRSAASLWTELSLKYGLAFVILGHAHRLYTQRDTLLQVADTAHVLSVSVYSLALLSLGTYLTKSGIPRLMMTVFWVLATLLLVVQKYTTSRLIRHWWALAYRARRVLICGINRETRRLFSYLLYSPDLGRIPVGFLDVSGIENRRIIYSHDYNLKEHAPVISQPLSKSLLRSLNIEEIFVATTASPSRMDEIMTVAAEAKVSVSFVGAGHPHFADRCTAVQMMDGLMVTTFDADGEAPLAYTTCKRITDVLLSSLLILLTLPLWLVAAVVVKATSRGPVFFCQERTGQNGKQFVMFKFRSMYEGTPKYERSPESSRDRRITPVGKFLRKTSLDELPQLLNVLIGDMSLVGPRPEMPYVTAAYIPLERRRLSVPQGLTGLWQLSGDRKFRIHEALEYDLYYIENRRISLDFAILLHTLFFAMKGL
jgi:exopolysaccharide biosynthesis polyprenyl glycosylphosphotransferase